MEPVVANAAEGYITYVDPTDNAGNDNGKIFVGAAFPTLVKEAKPVLFPEKEKKEPARRCRRACAGYQRV